jgi:hypothetical protein
MAPFDMNLLDDWNPDGERDWWFISSDDRGRFAVAAAYDGDLPADSGEHLGEW